MKSFGNKLKLQAKFVIIVGFGLLLFAITTVAGVGYREYSNLEARLKSVSERELDSLNSLVDSVMRSRFDDPNNVAIKVFDGWFDSRNKEYDGKLWRVWGPSTVAYMKLTAADQKPKLAQDPIDEEALKTGRPVGRFVGDQYRYSLPIVMGKSVVMKQDACVACHGPVMGAKEGEVV